MDTSIVPQDKKICDVCGSALYPNSTKCRSCTRLTREPNKICIECGMRVARHGYNRCNVCLHQQRKLRHKCSDCGAPVDHLSTRCKLCYGKALKTPEDYHDLAKERGFIWIGDLPKNSKTKTDWKCVNGHKFENHYNSIHTGNGCPLCDFRINGLPSSKPQQKIFDMLGGIQNHKVGRYSIDIALQLPLENICVEFDCFYWHGNQQERDARKTKNLIALGWKVLRIKTNTMLPTLEAIQDCIFALLAGADYAEIVMPDWGKGKAK